MNWPIYFKDKLILGNSDSEIGIVCLWTPVNTICDQIDKSLFSVAGQLYSKEGINFILRNVLANPQIRLLVICGEERTSSGQALMNLIDKGVDHENKVLNTDYCQIHKEIPMEAINSFRQNVKYLNLIGMYQPNQITAKLKEYQAVNKPWAEAQTFAEDQIEFDGIMPTDQSVFKIRIGFA